jgi:hypothetical protein
MKRIHVAALVIGIAAIIAAAVLSGVLGSRASALQRALAAQASSSSQQAVKEGFYASDDDRNAGRLVVGLDGTVTLNGPMRLCPAANGASSPTPSSSWSSGARMAGAAPHATSSLTTAPMMLAHPDGRLLKWFSSSDDSVRLNDGKPVALQAAVPDGAFGAADGYVALMTPYAGTRRALRHAGFATYLHAYDRGNSAFAWKIVPQTLAGNLVTIEAASVDGNMGYVLGYDAVSDRAMVVRSTDMAKAVVWRLVSADDTVVPMGELNGLPAITSPLSPPPAMPPMMEPSFAFTTQPPAAPAPAPETATSTEPSPMSVPVVDPTPMMDPAPAPPMPAPMPAPAPTPTPAATGTSCFDFTPFVDSNTDNIEHAEGLTPDQLAAKCLALPNCMGYNSNGWIKSKVDPPSAWYRWSDDPTKGFYLRRSECMATGGDGGSGAAASGTGSTGTGTAVSSSAPAPTTGMACYDFTPYMDSNTENIELAAGLTPDQLAARCDSLPNCLGFNSNGWIKSKVDPPSAWYRWSDDPTKGFYARKSDCLPK